MKKYIIAIVFLLTTWIISSGQPTDPLVSKCIRSTGSHAKYLKDFRIQLGKASFQGDLRFRANMTLWKNKKYRFSLCTADDSKGQLILYIRDESNKVVRSSVDEKNGKINSIVDFVCKKSGIYRLCFDFTNGQPGSGVGVVSMIK